MDTNNNGYEYNINVEIQRLMFLGESLRTKVFVYTQKYEEVQRQLMYLQNQSNQPPQMHSFQQEQPFQSEQPFQQEKPFQQEQSFQQELSFQQEHPLQLDDSNLIHQYSSQNPFNQYFNDGILELDEQQKQQQQQQQYQYEEDEGDEEEEEGEEGEEDDEDQDEGKEDGKEVNSMNKQPQEEEQQKNVNTSYNQQQPQFKIFPYKLLKTIQPQKSIKKEKKNRISTLLASKKIYPFKKMKVQFSDEASVVEQKKLMIDKYCKFLEKLKQEMPFYISDFGQIRYPDYIKKKVAFFCRYRSRSQLIKDTKIGSEAVAKWVNLYIDWMDDKLEKIEQKDTFDEYLKSKSTKSSYLIKKQLMNCQPNLNQVMLKQIQPLWLNQFQNHPTKKSNPQRKDNIQFKPFLQK